MVDVGKYGEQNAPKTGMRNYVIPGTDWEPVDFKDFFATRSNEIMDEDKNRKNNDRANKPYLTYLDTWSSSYIDLFRGNSRLPEFQMKILDLIIRVYIKKGIKDKVNFWDRRTIDNGGNVDFFEKLKWILDTIDFEWVNQTDLAQVFEIEQNELSKLFQVLCDKWILTESWRDGKKKLFKIADIDLLGFYIMRYI